MEPIKDRADKRKVLRVGQRPPRRSGIVSSADIEAAVKASGVQDDNELTGPMGIRDNNALRKNADNLRKGK